MEGTVYLALCESGERPGFTKQGAEIKAELAPYMIPSKECDIWMRQKFYDPWIFYRRFTVEDE